MFFLLHRQKDVNNNNNIYLYFSQIQLYSFQMRLTIKDLKIYRKKKDTYINKNRNYVIDKLTCEIMENKPLGSRM